MVERLFEASGFRFTWFLTFGYSSSSSGVKTGAVVLPVHFLYCHMNLFAPGKLLIWGLLASFCFSSCSEKKTTDPVKSYEYWSGSKPPSSVKVIHGKYWQSAHFTKEFILYMELRAPRFWIDQFIIQNKLIEDSGHAAPPPDAPIWFHPNKNFQVFKQKEFSEGSLVFEDTAAGRMFLYEIQL